jgi:myo-inositol 2-dehydrogenase/D-chiro-inositol 1-dehydrogenase
MTLLDDSAEIMKLRIGFIGLGAMGLSHARAIHKLCGDKAEITALCGKTDANFLAAKEIAPNSRRFKRPSELIQSPLDAIFVSTPNFTHAKLAEEVLGAGKHLFLEKPCGITRNECYHLLDLANHSDRVFMLGHELRYSPFFQKIKELVDRGEIGNPRMVWTREFRGPFQKKSGDWIQDERLSGGCLVDKNCHHFDLMNWWVGARPQRVSAFGGCAVNRVIEGEYQIHDHATVNFEYENGVRGTLQLCMFALDFPNEDLEMGIIGDAGMLVSRISRIEILQWKHGTNQKEPIVHKINARQGEGWGNHLGFDEIHHEFVSCILEKRQPLTCVRNCIDGTLLAIAAERAIKAGQVVAIDSVN